MESEKLINIICYVLSTVLITITLNETDFFNEDGSMSEELAGFMNLLAGYVITGLFWILINVTIQSLR